MPYFVGDILELPLTTVQDYTLFHILNDYSITLWKEQIRLISQQHGLVSIITHPDYLIAGASARCTSTCFAIWPIFAIETGYGLRFQARLMAWWRNRHQIRWYRLVIRGESKGRTSHRARVAYATLEKRPRCVQD